MTIFDKEHKEGIALGVIDGDPSYILDGAESIIGAGHEKVYFLTNKALLGKGEITNSQARLQSPSLVKEITIQQLE